MLALAQLVRTVVGVIVALIVVAILLRVFEANRTNSVVEFVHDFAHLFVGPFDSIFSIDNRKTQMAVNWGLAAVLWSIVGGFVASALARAGLAAGGTPRDGRV
ncbi:hypothetical protein DSM112329_05005 [Paraconexibacter sp. AEG42_29]|uniref:YggT family protein n=1 Tax=Paraconexibacter sp. AEG42_29 TaxID=2997339 RepID=A0AAU7B2F5_9ACTN